MSIHLVIACGAAVAALTVAPVAHADADTDFTNWMVQHGLGCGDGCVLMGHMTCQDIDFFGGVDRYHEISKIVNDGIYNRQQATIIVAGAVAAYCPWDG